MAVPFRRTSKTAKRLRRTHFKLDVTGLVACPHCGAMVQAHHVCPKCGYYAGKEVLHIEKTKGAPTESKADKK
jgi:large subunit ribosomal protein L32